MISKERIYLDLFKNDYVEPIGIVLGDNLTYSVPVTLTNDFKAIDFSDYNITATSLNSSGRGSILGLDIDDETLGMITIYLNNSISYIPGTHRVVFRLQHKIELENVAYSNYFDIKVHKD